MPIASTYAANCIFQETVKGWEGRTRSDAISHRSARNGLSNFLQRPVDLVVRLQLPLLRDERIPQGIDFSHTRIVVAGPYSCLYEYQPGARVDYDPLTIHTL